MCTPECLVVKIVEQIAGKVIEAVGRQLSYPFYYKKNKQNLEDELKGLQEKEGTISTQIEEAKTRGEDIDVKASEWKNAAASLTELVEKFMEDSAGKESFQCFKFPCPNFISRYKLSKLAKAKTDDVKKLSEKAHFEKIAHPKPPPPELLFSSIGGYMDFSSRVPVFHKIMEELRDSKVNVIGVYGIGGVGKTTTVQKVGEEVQRIELFDQVVVAVVSKDATVAKIQRVLADRLSLSLKKETEQGRAGELWNRLDNGKRNLVILDDIWEKLDLKEIGIPITDGNRGCKVVLTSRNRRVLRDMSFYEDLKEVYRDFQIEELSEEEAWTLFKRKMGNDVDPRHALHDIAKKVCRECRGLPVVINAVGAALADKSMDDWKSSLDKLEKSMLNEIEDIDEKLFTSLRLSYDYLRSVDAKSCFLLCCSFPEDAQIPIQKLARHCMARSLLVQDPYTFEGARGVVHSVVSTLKTSCLLLDGKNDDFVKMHDVIRDVGISIAKKDKTFLVKHGVKEWPKPGTYENFSAISLRSETIREPPDELVCPELHTLMVESRIEIPDRFFSGTKKLVVLELNNVTMLPLPSSLAKLMELRMLCLNQCKLGDLTMLKYLKNNLEVLSLQSSRMEALPHEVGELTRLRLLDLGGCLQLDVIPNGVISKLVRLEELCFPLSFNNWAAATGNEQNSKVSLDELMSLPQLSTLHIHIPSLRLLAIDVLSQNLIRFHIEAGYGIGYVNEECSRKGVMLIDGSIDDDLNIWERLLGKPKWFNNLTQLEIQNCNSVKHLFTPSSARELQQLQRLKINACDLLESVIRNEGETEEETIENVVSFSQLKHLELQNLPCLISFYPRIKKATTGSQSLPPTQGLFNEKVTLPALEEIKIIYVPSMTSIWDMQTFPSPEQAANSSLPRLRTMSVSYCSNLVNVVKGFHKTAVRGTEKQVANYLLQLPQLRSLKLQYLKSLSSFDEPSHVTQTPSLFNQQVTLPALEEIDIYGVPTITAIWDIQTFPSSEKSANSTLPRLRTMSVMNCSNLVNVVKGFRNTAVRGTEKQIANYLLQLPQLRSLELNDLKRLSSFDEPSLVTQIPSLFNHQVAFTADSSSTRLQIKDTSVITETRSLFNHKVAFPALEELTIGSMPNITEIWDKNVLPAQSFSPLRSLEVYNCGKLMNVIPSHMLPVLHNMKSLLIKKVSEMEVIVVLEKRDEEIQEVTNTAIIGFPKLTTLELGELENLKGVCAYKSEGQLNFNVQSTLPALEVLRIESLPMITAIWSIQTFPAPENIAELSFSQSGINDISLITETRPLFKLQGCEMLPLIQNIEYLHVSSCSEMEEIIVLEKREEAEEATNKDIIEFPKLRLLKLRQLKKLKDVCAYKSRDQLYFDVQVVFPKLGLMDSDLDAHSLKIYKEAVSGNKEMMKGLRHHHPWYVQKAKDVSEDEDEETHNKEKAGPSEKRSSKAATRTPIPDKHDTQDDFKDEDEETPKEVGLSQKSLTKVETKLLAHDEDDLEDEDNSRDEDEETPEKAGTSKRKPIESATKAPIMGEDDKEDEDKETPKKAKVAQRE